TACRQQREVLGQVEVAPIERLAVACGEEDEDVIGSDPGRKRTEGTVDGLARNFGVSQDFGEYLFIEATPSALEAFSRGPRVLDSILQVEALHLVRVDA